MIKSDASPVRVTTENSWYDVEFSETFDAQVLQRFSKQYSKIFVISDANLAKKYDLKLLFPEFEIIVLHECGEGVKDIFVFQQICETLIEKGITRKSCLVAFGGGTVGDLVGFVASSVLRGVHFIQIPTTLLAMVDSSVGGKVAINTAKYKNMIGAFYPPKFVYICTDFLKSLPEREILCGLGEIVKYGIIWDEKFFNFLARNSNKLSIQSTFVIQKCVQIKAEVVSRDEMETSGLREILNFGHTFAHAFEKIDLSDYGVDASKPYFQHGEAVGFGMIYATKISNKLGLIGGAESDVIVEFLHKLNFTKYIDPKVLELILSTDQKIKQDISLRILKIMSSDKKNKSPDVIDINGIKLRKFIDLILVNSIGSASVKSVSVIEVYNFLDSFVINI